MSEPRPPTPLPGPDSAEAARPTTNHINTARQTKYNHRVARQA